MHSQKRRRKMLAAPVVPTPVITGGEDVIDETENHLVDVHLAFTFDGSGLPVATFEIWWAVAGGDFVLVDTIPSTARSYHQLRAYEDGPPAPVSLIYKIRYRGDSCGPFSNGWRII